MVTVFSDLHRLSGDLRILLFIADFFLLAAISSNLARDPIIFSLLRDSLASYRRNEIQALVNQFQMILFLPFWFLLCSCGSPYRPDCPYVTSLRLKLFQQGYLTAYFSTSG